MSAHKILKNDLLNAEYVMPDPGNTGTITIDRAFAVVPLVTTDAETRTLADPVKAGLRLTLYFKTDGGDCTVTADSAVDQAGSTAMTFADAGDQASFVSIESGSSFVWRAVSSDGVAGINPSEDVSLLDNESVTFGTDSDFTMKFDGTQLEILPGTDDTGAVHIGDGTTDVDFKWFGGTAAKFVLFDVGSTQVQFDGINAVLGDNDKLVAGDGSDFTIGFDATNLEILPAVDDTGAVHIGDGTTDCDFKWFSGASSVLFDKGAGVVTLDTVALTLTGGGDITLGDASNIALGTTTGTKIGTDSLEKLGFYNTTPIAQQTGVAVTAAGIHAALVNLGLITA